MLPTFIKRNQEKKLHEISGMKKFALQLFGYTSLDGDLDISLFCRVIASPIEKFGRGLSRLLCTTDCLVVKPQNKTSFEMYNLFRTMNE